MGGESGRRVWDLLVCSGMVESGDFVKRKVFGKESCVAGWDVGLRVCIENGGSVCGQKWVWIGPRK
jgi:hypothetical protein